MHEGAPIDLESVADATWSDVSLYGVLLTKAGGTVYAGTKKINISVDSSALAEGVASSRASELTETADEFQRSVQCKSLTPTFIGSDNKSNIQVASNTGSANRLRHALRRYFTLIQRVRSGTVSIGHVPDTENPADFLTKWVPNHAKYLASREYATNARHRVAI